MGNLTETEVYPETVYQIETNDAVLGGAGTATNLPHGQLANRTAYLKAKQDIILDLLDDDGGGGKKLPPSSTTVLGVVELATQAEVMAGASTTLAITPATLAAVMAEQANLLMPVGTIIEWPLSTPPTGFLELNGAAISRATYAKLFSVVGTTWGIGDGSTTFGLRDDRGEFKRGWDNGRGVDSGRALNSYQSDELGSHSHDLWRNAYATGQDNDPIDFPNSGASGEDLGTNNWYAGAIGSTGGAETRPRNVAVMYCVKH